MKWKELEIIIDIKVTPKVASRIILDIFSQKSSVSGHYKADGVADKKPIESGAASGTISPDPK